MTSKEDVKNDLINRLRVMDNVLKTFLHNYEGELPDGKDQKFEWLVEKNEEAINHLQNNRVEPAKKCLKIIDQNSKEPVEDMFKVLTGEMNLIHEESKKLFE